MTSRKDELTPASIDSEWPHQIALPADQVSRKVTRQERREKAGYLVGQC
jgi:hypothetical protein